MTTLDTNVLVRVLVDDPGSAAQCKAARAALLLADDCYIPSVVQAELVWVLTRAYGLAKNEVVAVLEHLAENLGFVLQEPAVFVRALELYRASTAGFSDCLIVAEARSSRRVPVLSFDRKLQRLDDVTSVA